jgi:cyclic pyranopterin phosphate synthase
MSTERLRLKQVQIPIVSHCINACAGCASFAPMREPWYAEPAQVAADLKELYRLATVETLTLFGGEPLLHPSMADLINMCHRVDPAIKVAVVTNGQVAHQMTPAFWNNINEVQVTRYPGKLTNEQFQWIADKCKAHGIKFHTNAPYFAKIVTPVGNNGWNAWHQCVPRHWCVTVAEGRIYYCVQLYYLPKVLQIDGTEGLWLKGLTPAVLEAYLAPTKPAASCVRCTGLLHRGELPWQECRDVKKWWELATEK